MNVFPSPLVLSNDLQYFSVTNDAILDVKRSMRVSFTVLYYTVRLSVGMRVKFVAQRS